MTRLILFAIVSLSSLAADAQTVEPSKLQDFVITEILPSLEAALSVFATAAIGLGVSWLNKRLGKYGLDISTAQEARLRSLAAQGCALAEEKAVAAVKAKQMPMPSSAKAKLAIDFVLAMASHYNLPRLTQEKADALVHSYLGSTPGVGASAGTAVGAAAVAA